MKKLSTAIVALILAIVLVFNATVLSQPNKAHAATPASGTQANTTMTIKHLQFALTALKPHLHLSDQGILSLDISSGTSVGLDSQTFALVAQAVPKYNVGFSKYSSLAKHTSSLASTSPAVVHPFFSSWWDAYTQCLSWPVNQIAREAGGMVGAAGGIISFWYIVAGTTLPAWIGWIALVAAILFIGTAVFCGGFATGYLIWG